MKEPEIEWAGDAFYIIPQEETMSAPKTRTYTVTVKVTVPVEKTIHINQTATKEDVAEDIETLLQEYLDLWQIEVKR